ncbi:MAG: glycosyltransferase family 9 protein [Ignavibacteria bacterium]
MRIIIIRQRNNQLGDLLCSLPIYVAIKKSFPDSIIALVTGKTNYPIPYRELITQIDRVIEMKRDNTSSTWSFLKTVKGFKPDIAIVPSTMSFSRTSHIIAVLSGAKKRVGVKAIDKQKNKFAFLLTHKKSFNWEVEKVHQLDRILDVVRQIGCDLTPAEIQALKLQYPSTTFEEAKKYLISKFSDFNTPIIGLHPGAGKVDNRWSIDKFAELGLKLNRAYKVRILLTAGQIDEVIVEELATKLATNSVPYHILKNAEIKFLGALLSMLNLYITNDTGVMHLAGFSGAKVLSLFGPTKGYEWGPPFENCKYIQSPTNNINDITVEEVFSAVSNLLQ